MVIAVHSPMTRRSLQVILAQGYSSIEYIISIIEAIQERLALARPENIYMNQRVPGLTITLAACLL